MLDATRLFVNTNFAILLRYKCHNIMMLWPKARHYATSGACAYFFFQRFVLKATNHRRFHFQICLCEQKFFYFLWSWWLWVSVYWHWYNVLQMDSTAGYLVTVQTYLSCTQICELTLTIAYLTHASQWLSQAGSLSSVSTLRNSCALLINSSEMVILYKYSIYADIQILSHSIWTQA